MSTDIILISFSSFCALCAGFAIGIIVWQRANELQERWKILELLCGYIAKRQDEIERVLKIKKED